MSLPTALVSKSYCDKGQQCEFFAKWDQMKKLDQDAPCQDKQPPKITRTVGVMLDLAQYGTWSAVGATANYLSGGDPLAGALFFPLTSLVNRGLNYLIEQSPIEIKKDGSAIHLTRAMVLKGTSMLTSALALSYFGYEVTNTALIVNAMPRAAVIAGTISLFALSNVAEQAVEEVLHRIYHDEGSSCPHLIEKVRSENLPLTPAPLATS